MHRSHEFRAERYSGPQHTSYTILSCLHAAFCILHWLMLTLSSAMDVGDSILSGAGTRIRLYLPQREHVPFMRTIMQFQMLDTVSRTPGLKDFSEVFQAWRQCYTEKAPNAWQRRGTQNTRNTYNQPNRPNRQTSQTKHQALPKGQPGRRITPINTAAMATVSEHICRPQELWKIDAVLKKNRDRE